MVRLPENLEDASPSVKILYLWYQGEDVTKLSAEKIAKAAGMNPVIVRRMSKELMRLGHLHSLPSAFHHGSPSYELPPEVLEGFPSVRLMYLYLRNYQVTKPKEIKRALQLSSHTIYDGLKSLKNLGLLGKDELNLKPAHQALRKLS